MEDQDTCTPDELLEGNRAPTDEERVAVEQFISGSDGKLGLVRERISDLRQQLLTLEIEESALLEAVVPYKRALAPFRQLPEDVIREIFIACLPTGHNPTMSNKDAPVLLTQISSGLRRIALTTPVLWAAIHIPVSGYVLPAMKEDTKTLMAKRAEGVKEWLLQRSGSLPLSISVHDPRDYSMNTNEITEGIIDTLIICCSRWKDIIFACLPGSLSRVAALNKSDVPLLQSVSFFFGNGQPSPLPGIWSSSTLLAGTTLRQIELYGSAENISNYSINWANITHLALQGSGLWDFSQAISNVAIILRQTTRLVTCDINVSDDFITESTDVGGEISLPFLKILVINELLDSPNVQGILGSIHAPLLEVLAYNISMEMSYSKAAIMDLLKRSTNVQELRLGFAENFEVINECLRCCPLLAILHIRGIGAGDNEDELAATDNPFLEGFVADVEAQCLCPQLEYFQCDTALSVSANAVRKFLTHRDAIPSLNSWKGIVMTVQCDRANEAMIDQLRSEVGSRIKLAISYQQRYYSSHRLSQGLVFSRGYIDDWWPSAITSPSVY